MKRLFVSFSGGKSSAYMAARLKNEYQHLYEMVFVIANTGQEREETLIFADLCDSYFGLNLVWVEAVTHHGERIGCTHKVVNFSTASRKGEPFEEVIQKYGIPNKAYPHCTRELKLNPMRSYIASLGWDTYLTAVGIRTDEPQRVREDAQQAGIIYPMVNMFPISKPLINDWWENQPFNLALQEHQGNCSWCWKKSLRKHIMLAREAPDIFEFPSRMESLYGLHGNNVDGRKRVFFRGHMSTEQLLHTAAGFREAPLPLFDPDENSGCSESCEAL